MLEQPLHLVEPGATDNGPIDVGVNFEDFHEVRVEVVRMVLVHVVVVVVVVSMVVCVAVSIEQGRTIRRSLIRTNDKLAQELVTQAVEVISIELRGGAFLQVFLCLIVITC